MSNIEDFFKQNVSSGVGIPSPKFDNIGDSVVGEILDISTGVVTEIGTDEPKLDKNGNTMPQIVLTIQTDLRNWENANKVPVDENNQPKPGSEDDGKRRLFIKYSSTIAELQKAIVASGATVADLRAGAKVQMRFDKTEAAARGQRKVYGFSFKAGAPQGVADAFAQAQPAEAQAQAPAAQESPWGAPAAPADPAPAADPFASAPAGDPPF